MLKDTYDLVNRVKNINVNTDCYLVSLDFESLFTIVPKSETIEIILDLAFKDGAEVIHELTRKELKKLHIICAQESHFQHNGEYYGITSWSIVCQRLHVRL